MDTRTLHKLLDPLVRRVRNAAARGVVRLVNDGAKMQALQIGLLADETADGVERFQEYGFRSFPFAGAEAAVIFLGGDRSHGLAIAVDDRRYSVELVEGEVAIFDDQGQKVHIKRDRIDIVSSAEVCVTAPLIKAVASSKVRVEAPILECTGDIKDNCDGAGISMEEMRTIYNGHTHPGDSGGTTGTPGSSM